MRRRLTIAAAVAVVVVLIVVFSYDVGRWLIDLRGWLGITLNKNGTSTDVYQSLSGLIPALAILSLVGSVGAGFRHINCAHKGCWGIGRVLTPDGHKLCHRCAGKPRSHLALPYIHPDHTTNPPDPE